MRRSIAFSVSPVAFGLVATVLTLLLLGSSGASAIRLPHVARIVRDGRSVGSAIDIDVRDFASVKRPGPLTVGATLDRVTVSVPTDDTIVVQSPDGRDGLTLRPGSSASFQQTGMIETVAIHAGGALVDDAYGFFDRVTSSGGIALTAPSDPSYSVTVGKGSVTVAVAGGAVVSTTVANTTVGGVGAGPAKSRSYVTHVDTLAHGGRSVATYGFGSGVASTFLADRKAAELGDAVGQLNLGSDYYNGLGTVRDYRSAIRWFHLAAAAGNTDAQTYVGLALERGTGVPRDYAKAMSWYLRAAARGNAGAQMAIGRLYDDGVGVAQDPAAAGRWYRRAAEQGDPSGQMAIAQLYVFGLGVPRDQAEANRWYRLAAAQGYAPAEAQLGHVYDIGLEVARDVKTAILWYELAAEQGNSDAQDYLGRHFERGNGVERNYATAMQWYRLAAQAGNGDAEGEIGFLYYRGSGVPQSSVLALVWFAKSAEHDGIIGEYGLGLLYERGDGVRRDYAEALRWYKLAAAYYYPDAIEAVKRVQSLLAPQPQASASPASA